MAVERWAALALNHRARRGLTASLRSQWLRNPTFWRPLTAQQTWHGRSQRWNGWPKRGIRVGEASKPGPEDRERSPPPNRHSGRTFCPVATCPCSAPTSRGWASIQAMRPHMDDHAAGTLQGAPPPAYLTAAGLELCGVCGLTVASRYNGAHPRCRPTARFAAGAGHSPHAGLLQASADPDLAQVCSASIPVLRHVPKVARTAFAQCLARALADVVSLGTIAAWTQLMMLPKAVLRPAPRGGQRHCKQTGQFTLRRCERWLAGERGELWEAPTGPRRRRAGSGDEDADRLARQSRCLRLAGEGEMSRACAALVSPPLLDDTAEIATKLRAKHPQAPPAMPAMLPLGPPSQTSVPDLSVQDVLAAVKSFPRGSAGGPTGLRGDHLREALNTAHGDEVAAHLTQVVQILLRGQAPPELAAHFAGGTLYAQPKGADDVRPIAVGEALRRLASKCLCAALREEAQRYLAPIQVGVGVSLGAEAAVHTARHWAHRHAGHANKCFLTVDFTNAFNSVDRASLLREVRLRMPGLAPYVEWCYGNHTRLLFAGSPMTSEAGVQQGDPLGPLLFALALQPALRAAQGSQLDQRPDLVFAYLDDVCLAGTLQQVSAALGRLTAAARQVGLALNPAKCELTTCSGDGLVDMRSFPPGVKLNRTGAFSLLGAPVGNTAFCEAHAQTKRVEASAPLLQALAELGDPQTGLLLLRQCASFCKVAYATRVTPPLLHCQAMDAFDGQVRACLERLCTGPLSAEAWEQSSLSTSCGGLGLRHAGRHGPAAYIASIVSTTALCSAMDTQYAPELQTTIAAFNQEVSAADRVPFPVPTHLRQQQLSKALDKATFAQLSLPAAGREAFRAHLQLLQQPGAGAWLHAPPCEALGLHVAAPLFRVMVQLRLRLPVAATDMDCPLCDGVADSHGDHARVCPCGGDRVKRHNRLRSVLAARAQSAGLSPEVEKPNLLPQRPDDDGVAGVVGQGGRRPADVWVPSWGVHGPAAFDFAVTSGLRQGFVSASAASGSRATEEYETRKRVYQRTQEACAAVGLQFVPLIAEACGGGWGPAAMQTWETLAEALATRTGETAAAEKVKLLQALSITLQRENARAVVRRAGWDPAAATAALDQP